LNERVRDKVEKIDKLYQGKEKKQVEIHLISILV